MLPSIHDLNKFDNNEFIKTIHLLFEPAPPLVNYLLQSRPFTSYMHLIDKADQIISTLTNEDKIIVVNAHPRIGAPSETLSALSAKEQGVPVDGNLKLVLEQLARLNQEYEDRFGFKFVVFVNGRSRDVIVDVLKQRLGNEREQELATGLRDMILIARDRLNKLGEVEYPSSKVDNY
jgi:OHCU decarboxylase